MFIHLQELLQMVPQPVVAVLFLFPVTKESEAAKETGSWVRTACTV